MSVARPQISVLCRSLIGVLAVLALVAQSASPAMARRALQSGADGVGMWIEICADSGPMLVRLRGDGTVESGDAPAAPHGPCPKCLSCSICAADGAAVLHVQSGQVRVRDVPHGASLTESGCDVVAIAHLRPMTRGPPELSLLILPSARVGRSISVTPTQEGGAL